jgi:hypothetical protein
VDINRVWEAIRENIKIAAKHKPWFEEGYSKLLDQRKKPNCNGYRIQMK